MEAHSHKDGVINGKTAGRRWDLGILVPGVSYTTSPGHIVPPPIVPPVVFRVTTPLTVSPKIGEIQQALLDAGFDPKGVDNIYGTNTAKAVIAFQKSEGLAVDGEVGAETAAALGVSV